MTTDPNHLSELRRRLLEKRLLGTDEGTGAKEAPEKGAGDGQAIPRRTESEEPARLSFAQERFWFLNQLNPHSPAYNMHEAVRLRGPLDLAALQRALDGIVQRHAALRTTFGLQDAAPVQHTEAGAHVPLVLVDLSRAPEQDQPAAVRALGLREARHPFELGRCPLLRLTAARLAPDDHVLFFTIHHIISDEWSNRIFWGELAEEYQAQTGMPVGNVGLGFEPEPPAIQYPDYAWWQRETLEGGVLKRQMDYWKSRLADPLPRLQLPFDRPRPAVQTFRGALARAFLPAEMRDRLHALARQAGATPFMALLAVYAAMLGRYSGQVDLLVGTPAANRSRPETQNVMGLFLNTLVLRLDLAGGPGFRELLGRVRAAVLAALANQDLPFERLVQALQPERDLSYNPLFQVMFVYQEAPGPVFSVPGLQGEPLRIDGGVSKFDLTLFAVENPDGLELFFEYSTDLFDTATAERMLEHFKTLAQSAGEQPDTPVNELPVLSTAERRRLLVEWNQTAHEFPRQALIHELISEWAARTPTAPAVISRAANRSGSLTFAELERRANQLARFLKALNIRAGGRVGICAERSPEMIVAMLGVLKAGAAYVPLDPAYPPERLASMLADAGVGLVLAQEGVRSAVSDGEYPVVLLDRDWGQVEALPGEPLERETEPDGLAYIIYTSGSTGRPKGVPVSHRNLVHSTTARSVVYPRPPERFLLLSSFAFDSSVAGIYGSLALGGALCLPEAREEQDVHALAGLISGWQITDMLCLPALYAVLLEHAGADRLRSLRTVIVAGEACPPGVVRMHQKVLPEAGLYNEYGPTEGTVWSTVYRLPDDFRGYSVPIGQPVPNMQAYVLDPQRQPVPVGVTGELYIAGEGLVSGYLNRPELTADRFISHAFPETGVVRLYRTGDLARWLPDGNLEFLGRADQQVKLRGYRIELEEIEAAILAEEGVRQAAVVLAGGPGEDATAPVRALQTAPERLAGLLAAIEPGEAGQMLAEVEGLEDEQAAAIWLAARAAASQANTIRAGAGKPARKGGSA